MTEPTTDRAAALASLAAASSTEEAAAAGPTAPAIERTGREVNAGGDVARVLVKSANLFYVERGVRYYPEAVVGDVVLLSQRQADRLDKLGATVDPDADLVEVAEQQQSGEPTGDQLEAMKAGELVAYVEQHADDREAVERVQAVNEARGEKAYATVTKATAEALAALDERDAATATATGSDGSDGSDGEKPPQQ